MVEIWILRQIRWIFFWVYLWQLKEYHIGRFLAHFSTAQGKRLLLQPLVYLKIFLLCVFLGVVFIGSYAREALQNSSILGWAFLFVFVSAGFLSFLVYALEGIRAVLSVLRRTMRMPVFTKKTVILVVSVIFAQFVLLALFGASLEPASLFFANKKDAFYVTGSIASITLITLDLLNPIIVSAVVLAFQPFAVLARNRIIRQAREKRKKFKNLKVVGITGSYGKTSTKEFLAYILGQKFQVLKTPKHMNSEMGIAQTILRSLTDEHDIFVCEMGAYNKGGIKLLADIVKPDIGIVTGVNEQHLATFGSMENLLSAEGGGELAEALPKEGVLFVNQNAISRLADKIHYNAKCKVSTPQIPQAKVAKDHIFFEVEGVSFRVPVYGGHNVQNLLLAIAAARELGMKLEKIAKASELMPLELSAMKVKKVQSGATVIDSTYSANPDGVIADLEYLNLYEGKKVLVMPCLIELGPAATEAHRRIGQKIAEVCDLAIITTKEHFKDIQEGVGGSEKVVYMDSAQGILEKIKGSNAILLEGGKESRLQLKLLELLWGEGRDV
ncbi:MAG: UDP-N-acetylmuramoyl-tripeptide--D-alanyl-D-alanine ligase [Candidatus Wildermuthbacteria bacterium]|nr:UDP-N-acetylmuramoyl-tripeptide--D-alanyl-D-alanine ligase [Candidatus Wildermuthbacteria bacterium]